MGLPLGRWLAGVVALVWATAAQAAAPFEDSMTQRTLACTACHGDQGRAGPDGYYPRLAGKPAGYRTTSCSTSATGAGTTAR